MCRSRQCEDDIRCGDGRCAPGVEDCGTCHRDCPCPTGETCIARRCQVPEGCGDKLCAPGREDCGTCPGDCPCPEGQTCFANRCQLIGFFASAGGPYRGVVDQLITFEAAVTTNPGETVTDYLWDFGDGSVESGRAPSHAYGKEGSFLVRLTVKTDKGLTSQAMTTATVLPSLAARDFSTDAYFSYDADIDALTGGASMSIAVGSTLESLYDAVLVVFIFDPTGVQNYPNVPPVWDSGLVVKRVEMPIPDALRAPAPGYWLMQVDYFLRARDITIFPPVVPVAQRLEWAVVPEGGACEVEALKATDAAAAAAGCKVKVSPKKETILDGHLEPVTFTGTVTGDTPTSFAWSFTTPSNIHPPSPDIVIDPLDQAATKATARWFASPNLECPGSQLNDQALKNSEYRLRLDVTTATSQAHDDARLIVKVPWAFERDLSCISPDGDVAAAYAPMPSVSLFYDAVLVGDRWQIDLSKLAVRREPTAECTQTCVKDGLVCVAKTLTRSSQFFTKLYLHELDHFSFLYDPGRLGSNYWRADDLKAELTACTQDGTCTVRGSREDLIQRVRQVRDNWIRSERQRWNPNSPGPPPPWAGLFRAEVEAYGVSDRIEPRFLYQGHCRGYK